LWARQILLTVDLLTPWLSARVRLRIPAKEIGCSELMPIIYRAQQSRQFYVERLIDISQENRRGGEWL
jgi:hypothetical protein